MLTADFETFQKTIENGYVSLTVFLETEKGDAFLESFIFTANKNMLGLNVLHFHFDFIEFEKDPLFYIQYCFLFLKIPLAVLPVRIDSAIVRYVPLTFNYRFFNE